MEVLENRKLDFTWCQILQFRGFADQLIDSSSELWLCYLDPLNLSDIIEQDFPKNPIFSLIFLWTEGPQTSTD